MANFNFQQERDFSEKINATFQFISENFKPLGRLLLLFVAPFSILAGIFQGLFQSGFGSKTQALTQQAGAGADFNAVMKLYSSLGQGIFTDTYYLLALLFSMLASMILILVVNSYILEYQENSTPVSQERIFERVKKYALSIIGFTILSTVLSIVGFIFCLLPGIYLIVCFSMGFIIIMREDLPVGSVMSRCFFLIRDKWWSTFGLLVIMYVIFMIITMALAIPTGIITASNMLGGGSESNLKTLLVILYALIQVVTMLAYMLFAVAIAFQYFNLVEKKEGTGLLSQIANIGKKPLDNNEGEF